jgi:hypothetical protein
MSLEAKMAKILISLLVLLISFSAFSEDLKISFQGLRTGTIEDGAIQELLGSNPDFKLKIYAESSGGMFFNSSEEIASVDLGSYKTNTVVNLQEEPGVDDLTLDWAKVVAAIKRVKIDTIKREKKNISETELSDYDAMLTFKLYEEGGLDDDYILSGTISLDEVDNSLRGVTFYDKETLFTDDTNTAFSINIIKE